MSAEPSVSILLAADRLRRQVLAAFPDPEERRQVLAAFPDPEERRQVLAALLRLESGEELLRPVPSPGAAALAGVVVQWGEPLTAWGRPIPMRRG